MSQSWILNQCGPTIYYDKEGWSNPNIQTINSNLNLCGGQTKEVMIHVIRISKMTPKVASRREWRSTFITII